MIKKINFTGIIILVVVLAAIQFGVGLFLSPALGGLIVDKINDYSEAKIDIEKVTIWPLTLSLSLKELKVFDPDDTSQRLMRVGKASVRVSPLALLSKRLVFSEVGLNDVDMDLKGEPDGSFNIQKLARSEEDQEKAGFGLDFFKKLWGKKDWFTRVYDIVKKRSSKEAIEEEKQERKDARKVTRDVIELPRGRRVEFKIARDEYVFEIRDLNIKNATVHMESDQGNADVDNARIRVQGIAFDPEKGARFNSLDIRGRLSKDGTPAGSFDLSYDKSFKGDEPVTVVALKSDDIDMSAIGFIYQDSLPVDLSKGLLSLNSKTTIVGEEMDSRNSLLLIDHQFSPKSGKSFAVGVIPSSALCDALNQVDKVKLKFDITGTVEKPQFSGFQESLMELLKPYLANVQENIQKGIKEKGMDALNKLLGRDQEDSGS